MKRLPKLIIQGMSVRDYAYSWIRGGCELHQWCSGAKGIDQAVIFHVFGLYGKAMKRAKGRPEMSEERQDAYGLLNLLHYLKANKGHQAENYIPDEFTRGVAA